MAKGAPKPPKPPVTAQRGQVNVRKLNLPVGPVAPKPGSMLIEKKRKPAPKS
jgi:hypothetical protein